MNPNKGIREFGDFQTPDDLALRTCKLLLKLGVTPATIIEPSCGRGAFLKASAETFPESTLFGLDINRQHLNHARNRMMPEVATDRLVLREGDFFKTDWSDLVNTFSSPLLILGNPPWVTSAELGALESLNLPQKSNVNGHSGIEALTGKSNFDISESMLQRHLDWLKDQSGWIAVLVKTSVARKILVRAWKTEYPLNSAAIYSINAMKHFGAAVDACLFMLSVGSAAAPIDCAVFDDLDAESPSHFLGFHDGALVANVADYERRRHLNASEDRYTWRSGIKHDCSKVMELRVENDQYHNGLGEVVEIEDTLLFPLLKSSDVNGSGNCKKRFMVVTQTSPGAPTDRIRDVAPLTWDYLTSHRALLDKRVSSVYRGRPAFSIFGVGEYSFAPWKVAISGFYKSLKFTSIGPLYGRAVVFDDTVYFLPCKSKEEAEFLAELLNSAPAQEFFRSMVFWTDKRPITIDLLKRLSIAKLAAEHGMIHRYEFFSDPLKIHASRPKQLMLLDPNGYESRS